jgi:ketosteroid isomerase-like protein
MPARRPSGATCWRPSSSSSAIIADGDTVVVESRGGVTTKAGARYENDYCWVFRVRDDKIASITEYMDTELVTKALTAPPTRVEA